MFNLHLESDIIGHYMCWHGITILTFQYHIIMIFIYALSKRFNLTNSSWKCSLYGIACTCALNFLIAYWDRNLLYFRASSSSSSNNNNRNRGSSSSSSSSSIIQWLWTTKENSRTPFIVRCIISYLLPLVIL